MFLLKTRRGEPACLVDDDDLRIRWQERQRPVRPVSVAGQAVAMVVEHAGWDKSHLRIGAVGYHTAEGDRRSAGLGRHVDATAAGVKTALRRLRPAEAADLADVDNDIARLQNQLQACRRRRAEVVERAWQRANVVRLADVVERIPDQQ